MTVAPPPRIAVLYATAPGSSRGIAEFVWDDLVSRGAHAELHEIAHAPDVSAFDTVVLGGSVQDGRLPAAAMAYLRDNLGALEDKELWLFGVSPAPHTPNGRHPMQELEDLLAVLRPRDYVGFRGGHHTDLCDWQSVRRWSDSIALAHGLTDASVGFG
ncbi:flavodoxin domain-containing protein [Nocardia mangyaensis]|uniref:flavodoxin domain-containing protein n=1 Tax=Nocardia mangyaensis TaxID=2213200 RepID=UPI002676984D|nr:flavodoxin domain-containing protein [Nocardia mangyaensis]MDO3647025.1 flavodoxin domain-containing protein [Nocardia mangyaensis]